MAPRTPRYFRLSTGLLLLLLIAVFLPGQHLHGATPAVNGFQSDLPVAPGVQLTRFTHYTTHGPVQGQLLTVDLTNAAISTGLLTPGPMAAAEPLSQMTARSQAVASINGDFFDMEHTNAPYGVAVSNGQLLKGPIYSWVRAAGVGVDGIGRLAEMHLNGTITLPDGEVSLAGLNQHNIVTGGISMYTTAWGPPSRARAVENARDVHEVVVQNGVVVAKADGPGSGWIAADSFVLLGREDGAARLAQLPLGAPVSVRYAPYTNAPAPFNVAVGGREVLLRDGQIVEQEYTKPEADRGRTEPRSAIGFSADGRTMFLVTIEGRRRDSSGMTVRELAAFLQALGADDALNLDGGGSTTMMARKPGEWSAELVNRPSGGRERAVPNGLGIFVQPGSGRLAGLRILPALGEPANRVFAGLSRSFTAKGFDETYGPANASDFTWQSHTPDLGWFEPDGVFRASQPGTALVQVEANGADGRKAGIPLPVEVLPLLGIRLFHIGMDFAPGAGPGYLAVVGLGPDGKEADIETRDISLSYDPAMLDIVPVDLKHFQVVPKVPYGVTAITANIAGQSATLPINIGLTTASITEFERAAEWYTSAWKSTSTLTSAPGISGQSLQITYDFTQSNEPRVASAQPATPPTLPGQPVRIGLWVRGSGHGEQLVFNFASASGERFDAVGPQIMWTDWQHVEIDIPQGKALPLQLHAVSLIEGDSAKMYTGQVAFDGLGVRILRIP